MYGIPIVFAKQIIISHNHLNLNTQPLPQASCHSHIPTQVRSSRPPDTVNHTEHIYSPVDRSCHHTIEPIGRPTIQPFLYGLCTGNGNIV